MYRWLSLLIALLFVKASLIILFLQSGVIGLGADEAQYWTWSQNLDLGYYSKPPAIAWQIKFGTLFLGNSELGVRLLAVAIAFLLPLAVYFLAKACKTQDSTAFWSALTMALSPLGFLSSLLATTDGGMVFFWTLSCVVIVKSLSEKTTPSYVLLGFLMLCGALFKWPIYIFWIFVILAMIPFASLRSFKILSGIFISFFGLIPTLFWNYSHEWATFRHVFSTMAGGHGNEAAQFKFFKGNFLEFLGAQAALFSPILFILFVCSMFYFFRNIKKMSPSLIFCGGTTFLIFGGYACASLFQKIQGNWCVFAYPTAIVFLCSFASEKVQWGKNFLRIGMLFSLVLTVFMLSIPYIQQQGILNFSYKFNPFRHNMGWKRLGEELRLSGYNPETEFLFSDKYQTTSLLSFYGEGQKLAYFLNIHGARKNQFSYWPGMPELQKGKTGFFVWVENEPYLSRSLKESEKNYLEELKKYFAKVEYLGVKPLFFVDSAVVKAALIYKCYDYNGEKPVDPEKF